MDDDFVSEHWRRKTDALVGIVEPFPTLRFQVLLGRVYVLQKWDNGSAAHLETETSHLEKLHGSKIQDGWYDANGVYLADEPGFPKQS